jgi:PTH1 family peptidyl-tRNA hydrolase
MKLIIGLGNPGTGYAGSRHNIGFMCLSAFAGEHGITFDKKQGQARVGSGLIGDTKVVLARPQTYMNTSGQAVEYLVKWYKIELDDLIVIHDDLDLPLGKIRIRKSGGAAGHHGIESIVDWLGNPDFIRIRVGIGRPQTPESSEDAVIRFVLSNFSEAEKKVIMPVISRVAESLDSLVIAGLEAAMNKFNRNGETATPDAKNGQK